MVIRMKYENYMYLEVVDMSIDSTCISPLYSLNLRYPLPRPLEVIKIQQSATSTIVLPTVSP